MATKPVYAKTPSGGIQFISQRKSGEVRIPNYVYDIWMPLLGVQVVGVYAVYCRLEREHAVKGMNQNRLAKMLRIGTHALRKANALLEKCGFVTIRQPQGHERQMHFTTEITVLDPPDEVSSALIAELSAGDYEPLSAWLVAEPNFNPATPELQSSNAGTSIQQRDESGSGNAKIASLNLQPFGVASLGGLQPPPGARAREEPAGVGVSEFDTSSLKNIFQVTDLSNELEVRLWNASARYTVAILIGDTNQTETNMCVDTAYKKSAERNDLPPILAVSVRSLANKLLQIISQEPSRVRASMSTSFEVSDAVGFTDQNLLELTRLLSGELTFSMQLRANRREILAGSVRFAASITNRTLFSTLTASFPEAREENTSSETSVFFAPTVTNAEPLIYPAGSTTKRLSNPPSPPEWALDIARHAARRGRLRSGDLEAYALGVVANRAGPAPVKAGVLAMSLDEFVVER